MTSPKDKEVASAREKHETLYATFKVLPSALGEHAFKQSALIGLAIGWLATSQRTQEVLGQHFWMRLVATGIVVAITLMHLLSVSAMYRKSCELFQKLQTLAYMEPDYYRTQKVEKPIVITWCVVYSIISAGVIAIMWYLPHVAASP